MTLTKDKLVDIIRSKTNYSAQESKKIVETILEIIKSRLENGDEVKISGFGKWYVREKASRPGRNPHTGEKIEITSRKVVTFHPSEQLRRLVDEANLPDELVVMAGSRNSSDDDDNE